MPDERVEVAVDRELCVGSATCVGLAPDHFRLTDDGVSTPLDPQPIADPALRDAEESCPVAAILVRSA